MQINSNTHKKFLYQTKNNLSFTAKVSKSQQLDVKQKSIIYSEYKQTGERIEFLSKKYQLSLPRIAQIINDESIFEKYMKTNKTMQQVADEYFVTKQHVLNILKQHNCTAKDKTKVPQDTILAILNAQKSGIPQEKIIEMYAQKTD